MKALITLAIASSLFIGCAGNSIQAQRDAYLDTAMVLANRGDQSAFKCMDRHFEDDAYLTKCDFKKVSMEVKKVNQKKI